MCLLYGLTERNMKIKGVLCIILIASSFIFLSLHSVLAVHWVISENNDGKFLFIRNSNGKFWNLTEEAVGNATICKNVQNAIWDLNSSSGGIVWLPAGTMNISNLEICDNVQLQGVGGATILRRADNTSTNMIHIYKHHDIVISNLHVEGNNETTWTYYDTSNIRIEGLNPKSYNVTIRDCYFNNSVGSHIMTDHGAYNILIENCFFNGRQHEMYGAAIWFSGSNSIARNNFIKDTYACGIVFEENTYGQAGGIADGNEITGETSHGVHCEGTGSANVTIINNHIHDLNSSAYADTALHWSLGIYLDENCYCANNIIENVDERGISGTENCTIMYNIVRNVTGECGRNSCGIIASRSSIIIGNYVENIGKDGIQAYSYFDDCHQNIISNNIIKHVGQNKSGSRGIRLMGNGTISGNYIEDAEIGIYTGINNANMTVTTIGNRVVNVSNGSYLYGSNIFKGNYIDNCLFYGIYSQSDNATVSDNIIKNCELHGIHIQNRVNGIYTGNIIQNCGLDGINENTASDYNLYMFNNCLYNGGFGIDIAGANSNQSCNLGVIDQ